MLSIIIPTLNEEHHLSLLLESIKKQSFRDYEIIVADAGSKDRSIKIAKSHGCKVIPGGLPAQGRNEGAKFVKRDLILFLDADTTLPENFLAKALNEFKKRNLNIATCFLKPFGKNRFAKFYYVLFFNFPSLFLERIYPNGSALILIKKKLHQKVEGFDEKLKLGEDHAYLRKSAKLGKYRVLKSSKIFWSQRRFKKEGWFRVILKYFLVHLHVIFLGPVKTDIFKYRFGRHKK